MKKIIKIISITLVTIIVLVGALLGGIAIYDIAAFSDYYKDARKEFRVPGLDTNYTPQGIAYSKDRKVFLNSGYDRSNNEVIIYITDTFTKKTKKVGLSYDDQNLKGHAGGIAIKDNHVYVAEGKYIYHANLDELLSLENEGRANVTGRFKVMVNAAFCFSSDDGLYVGEFYDAKNGYSTNESHHIETKGTVNHALVVKYDYSKLVFTTGVSIIPSCAYSVCDRVQGVAVSPSGKMALSTSWGINQSHIYIHDLNKANSTLKTYSDKIDGKDVMIPVVTYTLNADTMEKDVVAPPMSEDLEYYDGRIYINNESASNKYIFGKFMNSKNVYSYPMD